MLKLWETLINHFTIVNLSLRPDSQHNHSKHNDTQHNDIVYEYTTILRVIMLNVVGLSS